MPYLVTGLDGAMFFDHTFGGEKIKKTLTGTPEDDETRLYMGGVEYVDGRAETRPFKSSASFNNQSK